MFELFRSFGRWLASTELSQATREALTNFLLFAPIVQTIHILSIAVVVGSAGAICLRLLGVGSQSLPALTKRFVPVIWGALVVMLLTGSVLVVNRPTRYFGKWVFLSKMALIIVAIVVTIALQSAVRRNPQHWEATSAASRTIGASLLLMWMAVIFAGRWIAYS